MFESKYRFIVIKLYDLETFSKYRKTIEKNKI